METLDLRESRSSLAGLFMAAAVEAIGVFELVDAAQAAELPHDAAPVVHHALTRPGLSALTGHHAALASHQTLGGAQAPSHPANQTLGGGGGGAARGGGRHAAGRGPADEQPPAALRGRAGLDRVRHRRPAGAAADGEARLGARHRRQALRRRDVRRVGGRRRARRSRRHARPRAGREPGRAAAGPSPPPRVDAVGPARAGVRAALRRQADPAGLQGQRRRAAGPRRGGAAAAGGAVRPGRGRREATGGPRAAGGQGRARAGPRGSRPADAAGAGPAGQGAGGGAPDALLPAGAADARTRPTSPRRSAAPTPTRATARARSRSPPGWRGPPSRRGFRRSFRSWPRWSSPT